MEVYYFAWIMSIILTFCMETKLVLDMIKDLADRGYKFNLEKLQEAQKKMNTSNSKYIKNYSLLVSFIPIINVLYTFKIAMDYYNNRELLIQQFGALGTLDIMDDLETLEYEKRPTGLNAIVAPKKVEQRLDEALKLKIDTEGFEGEVLYDYDDDTNDICILKVTGRARRFSDEKLKEMIRETINTIYVQAMDMYGSEEAFLEALSSTDEGLEFRKNTREKEEANIESNLDKSLEEEKHELKKLREELVEESDLNDYENDKGHSYTKK